MVYHNTCKQVCIFFESHNLLFSRGEVGYVFIKAITKLTAAVFI